MANVRKYLQVIWLTNGIKDLQAVCSGGFICVLNAVSGDI